MIKKREFISFSGSCPYDCKHCYTFHCAQNSGFKEDDITRLSKSILGKDFDIVYVSGHKENFVNPDVGIDLCEKLFVEHSCHIFAITRNVFTDSQVERLRELSSLMQARGKKLFVAVSISALESAAIVENTENLPTPLERINFLKRLYEAGILNILLLRPLFNNNIIPISETMKIVDLLQSNVSCVVASGLAVNDGILSKMGIPSEAFRYAAINSSEYLNGAIVGDNKLVDITEEYSKLEKKCKQYGLPLFSHSMEAANWIADSQLIEVSA